MKLWVLAENTACQDIFGAEHGLSLYLETRERRILFDMGQSSLFLENAGKLGIDLSRVDLAVLSHGHYDHGGGLEAFLEINRQAPVYVNRHAFEPHYHGAEKYIGLDPRLAGNPRLYFAEGPASIAPGITLHSHCPLRFPLDRGGLQVLEGGKRNPEDFRHEQYLLIEEDGKRILLSGCSHRGILNIMEAFRPDVLIGGFHLMKCTDGGILVETARRLLDHSARYYTGHCTGQTQFARMKEILGDRLEALSGGMELEL